jgi:hypothetical protein
LLDVRGWVHTQRRSNTLLDAAKLTPLSPANVLRDVVLPVLAEVKSEWHGYHAFRRGLATNMRTLSVDDLTIKGIKEPFLAG